MEYILAFSYIVFIHVAVFALLLNYFRSVYKIAYYEQRLKNNSLNDDVRGMSLWQMFTE